MDILAEKSSICKKNFKKNKSVVKSCETEYNIHVKYVYMYEILFRIGGTDMKGSMTTDLGVITIDPEVVAKYAGTVAVECFGIVGMAAVSMKDGLVKLLKRESLTHGIQVEISDDNKITINFHVIVSYGVSIATVCENLVGNVKYRVEEFTGMEVDKINIYVEGVRVID